jgi:putative hydrolase of the HAD superfamily
MTKITTLGFDADDTLWQNEKFFEITQTRLVDLLSDFVSGDHIAERLLAAEVKNIGHYGFGVKGFTLSMIETAIEVTEGRVPASVISEIMSAGRELLVHPLELLTGVEECLTDLAKDYRMVMITKGDLLDQERKLAKSGLGELFDVVEIVSEKTTDVYRRIFAEQAGGAVNGLMVGNSMKSDILPMINAGGRAIFVPNGPAWVIEAADPPKNCSRYYETDDMYQACKIIRSLP